jgi:diguanylate cyclase (GGDEF)-like protein
MNTSPAAFPVFAYTLMLALLAACAIGAIYAYTRHRRRRPDLLPVSRHALLENLIEGVLLLDRESRVADINSAAASFLGLGGELPLGADAQVLLAPWPKLLEYCNSPADTRGDLTILGRRLDVRAVPLVQGGDRSEGLLLVLRDLGAYRVAEEALREANFKLHEHVAEIASLQVKLREQAIRDSLTGLFNRRYLEETLQRELAQSFRSGQPLGIVMIDIDYFKKLNDTYGHRAGDLALQALGRLLGGNTRGGDVACRYGGEEFVLALPGATLEAALARAEQLRQAAQDLRIDFAGSTLCISISAGVAAYPLHGERADQVLDGADKALYEAKNGGRNRCVARAADAPLAQSADLTPAA